MKRNYLNLNIYNGMVSFENLEFKKDDTSSYTGAFDFLLIFCKK
ncbi:hypothetical protein F910_02465 [Acinetobacter baumannii NIPH 410]|nr:hypothetical protein F910_02465 [Acinetobacter baumannii NIPH 410]SSQ60650.1 Uncharacterised protein [Acinetobacter baumannii]